MNNFRKKLLIELAIAFIIISALGVGIWFFGSKIKEYSEEIIGLRRELARKSTVIDALARLKDDYDKKAKNYLGFLYSRIPLKDQLINLPREYRFLAGQYGLQYGFAFGEESGGNENTLPAVKFNINVSGQLNQLLNFVRSLGQFRYLNTVDSISLTSQGSGASMTVIGRVFFR
jgi:Tfp pilus assembly protein PilO